jgi:hypothetical protein
MLPHSIMDPGPTPGNRCEGASFNIKFSSCLKVVRLMRLRVAPPSTRMLYIMMLVMVGETNSGRCLTPTMFLGQSKVSKPIDVSIHLWWGVALGARAAATTARHRVLTTRQNMMSQEPPYMMCSALRRLLVLESESEWS